MLRFFRKRKADINAILIPDFGWPLEKSNSQIKQWINPDNSIALSINFFDLRPDIHSIKDIAGLRDFYRTLIAKRNGGLIQVDIINMKGHPTIKTIFKIPQEPTGITYLASLTIPFKKCSYVIKLQAAEIGVTGIRDTMVSHKLQITDKLSNWFEDPYNKHFNEGTRMNKSEHAAYDHEFPHHPLSQARLLLNKIEADIKLSEQLNKLDKY
jgi:hypothetical protein